MNSKSSILFILSTVFIDSIGFGIIIPIMPELIRQLTGASISEASRYGGLLLVAYSVMVFLFSPVLGSLSDQFGRRPVLLLSLFGIGVDYVLLSLAPTISWLFVGRIVAGIAGASITTASAYMADISSGDKRAQNFGLIGVAFGSGFIIGPLIGGLFSEYGTRVPFMIAAGLSLLNWLYGFFILPESLAKEHRREFNWQRANPLGFLSRIRGYSGLLGLLISILLIEVADQAVQSTWSYYTKLRFGWDEKAIGYSIAFAGVVIGVVQGGLIRFFVSKFGDKKSIFIGLVFYTLGFAAFAFAAQGWMMYAFMLPYALSGIATPTIQGIMSLQVAANQQGELQGIATSLTGLANIIGPLTMNYMFFFFTSENAPAYFPGAPFMLSFVVAVTVIWICTYSLRNYQAQYSAVE